MTPKSVADERTQKEVFFDRLLHLGNVGKSALKKGGDISSLLDGLQLLGEGKRVVLAPEEEGKAKASRANWLTKILELENKSFESFFGEQIDLTEFEQTLIRYGRHKIEFWQSLGLEPHYLPGTMFQLSDDYPGWKIKPGQGYYDMYNQGKILRGKILEPSINSGTILIDTRLKPNDDNYGQQMWYNDNLCGPTIHELRLSKQIAINTGRPIASRFNVSAKEWDEVIKPALACKLGLSLDQVRLETTIERNVIPQLYPHMPRRDDGQTETSVWNDERIYASGDRLTGGCASTGGLADVFSSHEAHHSLWRSFRPIVVL